ncbi:MAG: ribonuclease HI [Candidatus Zambryskibacteria bacterium]|nr:ribonuclease HI [Candidatus Zambryskibacteria bacterium]
MKAIIFTDGSSRGNPGPGGWGAVILEEDVVRELGGRESSTTNNRMELTAALEALTHTKAKEVVVHTDSSYLISGITLWISGWKKNNWQTKAKEDVLNRDLWEALDELVSDKKVSFEKVSGHAGVPGNERCDVIATSYADNVSIDLYDGKISSYSIDLTQTVSTDASKKKKSSQKNSQPAYSYISGVGGVVVVHHSWEECKARVHGVSGARFKKSMNEEDEKNIINEFKKQ